MTTRNLIRLPPALVRTLGSVVKGLIEHRRLIWRLTVHELRSRYSATIIGSVWSIVNPIVVILVFWFVSVYGLRITIESGAPFHLFLFCGLVPWMTFNEAVTGAAGSILHHQYLVKRIAFPLEILPIVHLLAALIVHVFLVGVLIAILLVSDSSLTMYALQAVYFVIAMSCLVAGLGWTLAGLQVFHRDVGQALGAMLTIWFWATPIVWPVQHVPERLLWLVQANPLYYIVEGYRNAFLYERGLSALWPLDLYFWGLTAALLLLGAMVFTRLRPHLADVL